MTRTTSVIELTQHVQRYIAHVMNGDRVIVLHEGRPVAELTPVAVSPRMADLPEILRHLPSLSNGDAEAFARDIDIQRTQHNSSEWRDPWA